MSRSGQSGIGCQMLVRSFSSGLLVNPSSSQDSDNLS